MADYFGTLLILGVQIGEIKDGSAFIMKLMLGKNLDHHLLELQLSEIDIILLLIIR
jgi:hypothetical protein